MSDFSITSNCPLCGEHSLHVIGTGVKETMQCINCGFASADKFKGLKDENNRGYNTLTDEMKEWAVHENGRVWIPTIMALPFGMLYPKNINKEMKWCWSDMVDIPEDEQKNYPDGNGGFYGKRIDSENEKVLEHFLEGMVYINEMSQKINEANEQKPVGLKLPKLKKK